MPPVPPSSSANGDPLANFLDVSFNDDGTLKSSLTGTPGAPGPAGTSVLSAFALNASTSISATSLTLATTPTATALKIGDYVGVGAGTPNCEVRRVTGVSGAVVTLGGALNIAHSSSENVWVTGHQVQLEWWGAVVGSSDSYRSLINAFLDQASSTADYELVGRGTVHGYTTSRPLFQQDYCSLRKAYFAAKTPFALDCTIGKDIASGIPNQVFFTLAGQFLPGVTFDAAADNVIFAPATGGPGGVGADVAFYPRPGSTMPGGIEEGRRYFVLAGTLTTQITLSQGSSTPVDITSAGSGDIIGVSSSLARLLWDEVKLHGAYTQGLNGLSCQLQQPAYAKSVRIEGFPVIGVPQLSGQQGTFENIEVTNCGTGIEFAGAEMIYLTGGGNVELCDTLVTFAENTRSMPGAATSNQGCVLGGGGFHFETAGQGCSLIQTLTPTGTLSSGTFQLRFKNVLTGAINFNDTAATIQTVLQAHAAIGSGNATVTQVTGTNLSNGPVRVDFTVGALNWSYLTGGSTDTRTGGQLAIVNSTIAGGTLAASYINPNGVAVDYRNGRGNSFENIYSNCGLIKTAGSANDVSAGVSQGYSLRNIVSTGQTQVMVDDAFHNELLTAADFTGCAQYIGYYERGGRHGGSVGRHDYFKGDGGRAINRNTGGAPLVEQIASSTQTDDLHTWTGTAGTVGLRISPNSYLIVKRNAAPVTSILAAGEAAIWFDSTNGAGKLMVTAKQADGTVKTGSFNVQT